MPAVILLLHNRYRVPGGEERAVESRSRTSASSPSSLRISQARSSTARSSPPGTR